MVNLSKIYQLIDKDIKDHVERLKEYLRQPGFSTTGEGIEKSAKMTRQYLSESGAEETSLVALREGNPVVYGRFRSQDLKAKTLLIYGMYDVVSADPAEWTVPPFAAEIVDATNINLPSEFGKVLVARGAYNQKGPLMCFLSAVQSILKAKGDLPVNLIFFVEGEEEIGSPHLIQFRDRYMEILRDADALYGPSMRQDTEGKLIINRGCKGAALLELKLTGGEWGGTINVKDLTSPDCSWVDAPLLKLIQALNILVDKDKVLIEDFYENYRPPTTQEREELKSIKADFDEEATKKLMGIKKFKRGLPGRELIEDYIMKPMLNIDGISGGFTGPGFKAILPMSATAKIDIRIVPNMDSNEVIRKLRRHLDKHGFAEIKIRKLAANEWIRTPVSAEILRAVIRAAAVHGVKYRVWPTSPWFNPLHLFVRPPLNLHFSQAGLGHGGRPHQPDEYVTLRGIRENERFIVTLLYEYAKIS